MQSVALSTADCSPEVVLEPVSQPQTIPPLQVDQVGLQGLKNFTDGPGPIIISVTFRTFQTRARS